MRVNDPGKLLILLVTICAVAVLLGLGAVSEAAGIGVITYALGYLSGNGRLAVRGKAPAPTLGPAHPNDRAVDELVGALPPDLARAVVDELDARRTAGDVGPPAGNGGRS